VPVPDVVGIPWPAAKDAIEKVGLVALPVDDPRPNWLTEPAKVTGQSPAGGSDVKKGTKITVNVYGVR
jgi:beta-lactam-binding protein with PASTA domain